MIYYFVPYATDKDLGKYYNRMMELLPNDDDYACFIDGDAMFTTPDYGHMLERITKLHSDVPLFTCMTNRVGTEYQLIDGMWDEEAMNIHRAVGVDLQNRINMHIMDITNKAPLSGVLILLRKKEWKASKTFTEGIGMLGVDNSIHYAMRDMGEKVFLMLGIYVMHYYRGGDITKKEHLL